MNYIFTLDSVFKLIPSKTQNWLDKPVCYTPISRLLIRERKCLKTQSGTRSLTHNMHFEITLAQVSWFTSVPQSCPTLCDPMDCSTPGFPVHNQLPELTHTHVHRVGEAIQPSHPLLSPSPAFNLAQRQGLFQWVSSSHQVIKVLEFQLQHQSFQWIFRTDFLWDWLVWSPCSSRNSQEFSPTPHFKSINSLALSLLYLQLSHPYMTIEKPYLWLDGPLLAK